MMTPTLDEIIEAAVTADTPCVYFTHSQYFATLLSFHDSQEKLLATIPLANKAGLPPFAPPEPIVLLVRQDGELVRSERRGFIASYQRSAWWGQCPGVEIEVRWT